MYKNYAIEEVTQENQSKYIDNIAKLEIAVLNNMIQQGKEGQLFITGKEDIKDYIESKNNHVVIAYKNNIENNENNVIAATYITEGQTPFTYNDLTKYFKVDKSFNQYVKNKYSNEEEYKDSIKKCYLNKIIAFRNVRELILSKFLLQEECKKLKENNIEKNKKLIELIEKEYNTPENNFHEKSELREYFNKQMTTYMKSILNDEERYNDFYWMNFTEMSDILKIKKKNCCIDDELESDFYTYDKIMDYQKYLIYDKSKDIDMSQYYAANTSNTIELDTYITSPFERENGLARILVYEGLKISLKKQLNNNKNSNVYLVSTLHRDNLSSKYVSEFFGLKDYLFVNRRSGRDRELHILKLNKNEINEYLKNMEKKIAVLYDYNPNGIYISDECKIEILKEQLKYEEDELARLDTVIGKYPEYETRKIKKIEKLMNRINTVDKNKYDFDR